MPLRSILENFLEYVDNLESSCGVDGPDAFDREFQELKILTDEIRAQNSCSCGEKEVNRRKNRYKDILPYDVNRVALSELPGVSDSDYINASYVKGASGSKAYIASQAPLPHTVEDFWRMIFETDVQVVVMASNEIEAGRPKCERYWPSEGEVKTFGDVTISLEQQREMCEDFKVRRLKVQKGESPPKILHHFHYHNWPDHGIPTSVTSILDMVELMRRDFQPSETLPVLVHCSAGCGRTGTVCAIDYVWGLLRTGKLSQDFSLKQLILDLRRQRIAMVQTKEQYILVYRAVRELFERHLKVIDDHPYENVDFSGKPICFKLEPDYENIRNDVVVLQEGQTSSQLKGHSSDGGDSVPIERSQSVKSMDVVGTDDIEILMRPASEEIPPLPTKTKAKCVPATGAVKPTIRLASSLDGGINNSEMSGERVVVPAAQSKMEYVNDWCAGITSSDDKRTKRSPHAEIKRLSLSGGSTTSSSASLTKAKAKERREKPIVSLVRKPSIAKLRELFVGSANSDTSSPPSPDSWNDPSPPIIRRERAATDPLVVEVQSEKEGESTQSLVRTKRRMLKSSKNYMNDKEYEGVVSRYMDVSLRIFKENKQITDTEKHEFRGSLPQLKVQVVSPLLSASSEEVMGTTASSTVSTASRSSPPRDDVGRLSPAILRHSPSPAHSSSPSPRDRGERMSELVGRFVRTRRNSASEKRNSTWYDEMPFDEEEMRISDQNASSSKPNRVALFFGGGGGERKSKSPEEKVGLGTSVKRSISMKVGFGSPFIRRRHNGNSDVAAYLAVEDNRKYDKNAVKTAVEAPKQQPSQDEPVKSQSKINRKLHGYVNVKPVQNPIYLPGNGNGPVQLKNFSLHGDDVSSLERLQPPKKSPSIARKHGVPLDVAQKLDVRECSPLMTRKKNSPTVYRRVEGSPVMLHKGVPSPASSRRVDRKIGLSQDVACVDCRQPAILEQPTNVHAIEKDILQREMVSEERQREDVDLENSFIDREVAEVVHRLERELKKRSGASPSSHSRCEDGSRRTRDSPPKGDDLYGSDMDAYCQKMLQDCHEYLLTHQYSNLTNEAKRNIRWIEDTIHRSPRHAIMDVTSSTENLVSCDLKDSKMGRARLDSEPHNYERLWLSQTGVKEIGCDPECSVEEATIVFPPQDDDDDEDDASGAEHEKCARRSHFGERSLRDRWLPDEKVAPRRAAYPSSPSLVARGAKDPMFGQTVEELRLLIDELELGAGKFEDSTRRRKPQPAPRTVLNPTTSESFVPGDHKSVGGDSAVHVYECIRDVDAGKYAPRQPKIEHETLLGSSCPRYFVDDCGSDRSNRNSARYGLDVDEKAKNHEYEEIIFADGPCKRPIREPLYAEVIYDGPALAHRSNQRYKSPNCIEKDGSRSAVTCLYGQVNKPRRRKRSHSHDTDGHDATVANSSNVRDCRVPRTIPIADAKECLGSKPVAPPRVRRQLSSASFSCKKTSDAASSELPPGSRGVQGCYVSKKSLPTNIKISAGYEVCNEEEDADAPPVPVKTKDAYVPLIPKGNFNSCNSSAATTMPRYEEDCRSSSSAISFGRKKLNKIQTTLFSKLGLKSDKDSDTSSNGSAGGASPKVSRKVNLSEIEFPRLLDKKPKGSRGDPLSPHWKATTA